MINVSISTLRTSWGRAFLSGLLTVATLCSGVGFGEDFENYEIRVIRPKFFSKSGRLELGTQMSVVMNQTFIYTYLATGILAYHINEQFAIEGSAAYGISFEKDDKTLLKNDFEIQTEIVKAQYWLEGTVLYTPIYGKYQLTSGRLIYFDTFLSLGGGMTGVNYDYKWCTSKISAAPAEQTVADPTVVVGGGQRFFLDKKLSLRWDVKDHMIFVNAKDASCNPASAASSNDLHHNVTTQLGIGYFL